MVQQMDVKRAQEDVSGLEGSVSELKSRMGFADRLVNLLASAGRTMG